MGRAGLSSGHGSGGVFDELFVRRLRPAANFFGHGVHHDLALGLFVAKLLNAGGDHGADRCELAAIHLRLGEGVMLVDEGYGGLDGHGVTASRSHTAFNAGHIAVEQPAVYGLAVTVP